MPPYFSLEPTAGMREFTPRRPHSKSRLGCAQCKVRKVKCDETKPICQKCTQHGQTCSFLQTTPLLSKRGPPTISSMLSSSGPVTPATSAPLSPSLQLPLPAQFTILDMELLHSWTTRSSANYVDFPACNELFKVTVVQMAFTHRFLMHEILAISALHLSLLSSIPSEKTKYMHASSSHLATALSLFQPEIAKLTTDNCHACFSFSTLIFTHSWAAQDKDKPSALFFFPKHGIVDGESVQWVKLQRGANGIIQRLWFELRSGPMGPLFSPWIGLDPNRPDPLNEIEERELSLLPFAWNNYDCPLSASSKNILSKTLQSVRRVFSMLSFNYPEVSKLSIVMAWFSWITEEYLKMLKDKVPEALLLVCFYCVALKRAAFMWWVEGKAENLLRTIVVELGEPPHRRWERYLKWPVEQVLGGGEVTGFGKKSNVDRLAVSDIMNRD